MDGENNGKTLCFNAWFGDTIIFGNTRIVSFSHFPSKGRPVNPQLHTKYGPKCTHCIEMNNFWTSLSYLQTNPTWIYLTHPCIKDSFSRTKLCLIKGFSNQQLVPSIRFSSTCSFQLFHGKKRKKLSRPSHMLPCKTVSFQRIKSNLQWRRGNFASIPSSQGRGTKKNSLVKKAGKLMPFLKLT